MGLNYNMAEELVRHQQEALDQNENAFWIGEQLLDMVRDDEHAAGILAQDLANNPGMGLRDAEKTIEKYAAAHKKGNRGCCPPQVAERLLREFYGLGEAAAAPQANAAAEEEKLLDLEDFL